MSQMHQVDKIQPGRHAQINKLRRRKIYAILKLNKLPAITLGNNMAAVTFAALACTAHGNVQLAVKRQLLNEARSLSFCYGKTGPRRRPAIRTLQQQLDISGAERACMAPTLQSSRAPKTDMQSYFFGILNLLVILALALDTDFLTSCAPATLSLWKRAPFSLYSVLPVCASK